MSAVLDRLRRVLAADNWFSSLGLPLADAELEDARAYLTGLGLAATPSPVSGWQDARRIATDSNWSRAWWQAEMAAQRALYAEAVREGETPLLEKLTALMEETADLFHGAAAAAAARDALADPSTVRAAAGAASQCAHQYALAHLAGPGEEHFLSAKFRLFLAGRWPLCVVGDRFHIF